MTEKEYTATADDLAAQVRDLEEALIATEQRVRLYASRARENRRQLEELLPWAHAAAELFADPVRARIWRHQKEASAFLERIDAGEFGPVPSEVA